MSSRGRKLPHLRVDPTSRKMICSPGSIHQHDIRKCDRVLGPEPEPTRTEPVSLLSEYPHCDRWDLNHTLMRLRHPDSKTHDVVARKSHRPLTGDIPRDISAAMTAVSTLDAVGRTPLVELDTVRRSDGVPDSRWQTQLNSHCEGQQIDHEILSISGRPTLGLVTRVEYSGETHSFVWPREFTRSAVADSTTKKRLNSTVITPGSEPRE